MRTRRRFLKKVKDFLIDILFYVFGGLIYAVAVNMFLAPNNILLGGFTGISTVLNYLFDIPIGTAIFVMNIPLFLIALKIFGKSFIFKTVIATFFASISIDLTAPLLKSYSGDMVLSALFGGLLAGTGLSLIFLRGSTTGGTDIIAKLLRKKFPQLSMGRTVLLIDLIIILTSFSVYRSLESLLYAFIVIFVSSEAIDFILYSSSHGKMLFIITDLYDEVSAFINKDLSRGTTLLSAVGGYTKRDKKMLFCAIKNHEEAKFVKSIKEIDDDAFIIVSDANRIIGEGFKRKKEI
ncbi:MAG: YitT family protein [Oscillospiraceae bacterium]